MSLRSFALAALCLVLAAPVRAQGTPGPSTRGLWGAVVFGAGGLKTDCNGCTNADFEPNGTFALEVGGTPSRRVRLGGETFVYDKTLGATKGRLALLMLATRFYPDPSVPVYFKAGFGLGRGQVHGTDSTGTAFGQDRTGLGMVLGFGVDLRVARNFSVTLMGAQYSGLLGDFAVGSHYMRDAVSLAYVVGMGVTIH